MNPTDNDAAERARLERIAWGAGSSATDATRARIALADLPRRRRRSGRPEGSSSGAAAAPAADAPSAGPSRPAWSLLGPTDGTTRSTDEDRRVAETASDGGAERPGAAGPDGPTSRLDARRLPLPATSDGGATDGPEAEHWSGAAGARDEWRAGDDAADVPEAEHRSGIGVADRGDEQAGASVPAGRVSGLLAGARGLAARVRRADRTALWVAAGVAVVVGLAVGTGAGVAVGAGQSAQPGTAVVTPTAGTVTVEQLLAAPQTYADQLPGAVDAPVMLRSTRLVFTNRSLSGDDAATPWAVWAGVDRDGKMICLVASADRLQGSSACYPREDALHGTVSMTAMSSSGTLWVSLKGGAVLATVTGSY